MNEELKSKIPGIVLSILKDNSGGIKLTELVASVMLRLHEQKVEIPTNFVHDFEILLEAMQSYHVYVLNYDWKLGDGHYRSKAFVYTKF